MHDSKHSKITNHKYLIVALLLFVGLIMSSCSSEGNTNNPASEIGEVVITFSSDDNLRSIIEPLIETFNEENPSITVQYVPLSADSFSSGTTIEDRLLMLASSADTTLTSIRSAQAGSYFLDLQPLIDSDASFDQTDFWHGTLAGIEDSEGRMMGLPMKLFLRGIFYDKSAFDAAYLPYPQPGWIWDDFRIATAALAKEERYGYADRESPSILQSLVGFQLALNDGDINAEALTAELEWYVHMSQAKQILGIKSSDDLWRSQFNSESPPAMWSGSLFEFALVFVTGEPEAADLKTFFADSAYGFAPFPVDADGENMNTTPITALYGAISIGSEHPLESWKWLKFLSEHWLVPNSSIVGNQLHIPARQSVAESVGFWDNYPPEVQEAMQYGLEHAWFTSLYPRAENEVLYAVKKVASVNYTTLLNLLQDTETQQASWPQEVSEVQEIIIMAPQPVDNAALGVETINVYYDYDQKASMTAMARQFNRDHQDEIVVQLEYISPGPAEEYFEQLALNYDCFFLNLHTERAASSGLILDLTALMEAEDAAFQQDFYPTLLDAAQHNGGLYALPISNQPTIMAYNADLLDELGLELPSLDWTFDEFLEMITAVSSSSEEEPIYGFSLSPGLSSGNRMLYAGRGVQLWDTSGDSLVLMFDTPEVLDATYWLAELQKSDVLFQAPPDVDWYSSLENVLDAGQIGFWAVKAGEQEFGIHGYNRLRYPIGIAPLPYINQPDGSYTGNKITGFYISSETEHPQACWELAKYVSERGDVLYGVPARISVANSVAWEAYVGADNAAVYRAAAARNLTNGEVDLYDRMRWNLVGHSLWKATQNFMNGSDLAQELALAQQTANAYLACMAPYDGLSQSYDVLFDAYVSCLDLVDTDW